MKKLLVLLGITFLISCSANDGEVVQGKDGMVWSSLDSAGPGRVIYQVDTITQNCFTIFRRGAGSGITETSCAELAKRPEWQAVLTWVDQ